MHVLAGLILTAEHMKYEVGITIRNKHNLNQNVVQRRVFCNALKSMQSQNNYKSTSLKAHLFDVAQLKNLQNEFLIKEEMISAENENTCEKVHFSI